MKFLAYAVMSIVDNDDINEALNRFLEYESKLLSRTGIRISPEEKRETHSKIDIVVIILHISMHNLVR